MKKILPFKMLNEARKAKESWTYAFDPEKMTDTVFGEVASRKGKLDIYIEYQTPIDFLNYCARKLKKSLHAFVEEAQEDPYATAKISLYTNVIQYLRFPRMRIFYGRHVKRALSNIPEFKGKDLKEVRSKFPPPAFGTIRNTQGRLEYFFDGRLRALAAINARVKRIPVQYFVADETQPDNLD